MYVLCFVCYAYCKHDTLVDLWCSVLCALVDVRSMVWCVVCLIARSVCIKTQLTKNWTLILIAHTCATS